MEKLSHKEAYVLDLLRSSEKTQNITEFSQMLLGLYAHAFLDDLEKIPGVSLDSTLDTIVNVMNEFFIDPHALWSKGDSLVLTLNSLCESKLIRIKKEELFDAFSLLRYEEIKGEIQPALSDETQREKCLQIINLFNETLAKFLKKYENQHSKYEVRYFWRQNEVPEVFDFTKGLLEPSTFRYKVNEDTYWTNEPDMNIKIRSDELHVKECLQVINNIGQFSKKRKISLPLQTPFFESYTAQSIAVKKARYTRKFGNKTKAEFSNIKINNEEWKTICLESNSFQTALGLSLLVSPNHAERLTYAEFLLKYGKAN